MTYLEPKFLPGHKVFYDGILWDVRGFETTEEGISYLLVPYESSAAKENLSPIRVKESNLI